MSVACCENVMYPRKSTGRGPGALITYVFCKSRTGEQISNEKNPPGVCFYDNALWVGWPIACVVGLCI